MSIGNFTERELALYLSRRQSDYKVGIPVAQPNPALAKKVVQETQNFVFVYAEEGVACNEFLEALIEKGLKSKVSEHFFMPLKELSEISDQQSFMRKVKDSGLKKAVIFGAEVREQFGFSSTDPSAPPTFEHDGVRFLLTAEISKLIADQQLKKVFWNNLRAV